LSHPRDRFITVYGRKPALEALADAAITIDKLWIATTARGEMIDDIIAAARARGVRPERRPQHDITRLSRNGRQDQGIALDVIAPRMIALADFIAAAPETAQVMLLDGVTTPGNVGLILRVATAAGFDGVVLPRVGCPEVGPLVIKASAGVAFRAPRKEITRTSEGARSGPCRQRAHRPRRRRTTRCVKESARSISSSSRASASESLCSISRSSRS
jgi:23S rRNA (guanosine2251-2'-O)-methyltransferase